LMCALARWMESRISLSQKSVQGHGRVGRGAGPRSSMAIANTIAMRLSMLGHETRSKSASEAMSDRDETGPSMLCHGTLDASEVMAWLR
jgi:hypothetical protein